MGSAVCPGDYLGELERYSFEISMARAGIHTDHSASDWEFLKPVYVNDRITPKCWTDGHYRFLCRQFVYLSDAVWFRGKVAKKYVDENGEYCVDIETHGINQRNGDTIPGEATVILPSREAGTSPVAKRLPPKESRGTARESISDNPLSI